MTIENSFKVSCMKKKTLYYKTWIMFSQQLKSEWSQKVLNTDAVCLADGQKKREKNDKKFKHCEETRKQDSLSPPTLLT